MLAAVAFAVLPVRIKELVYGNVQQGDNLVKGVQARMLAPVLKIHDMMNDSTCKSYFKSGENCTTVQTYTNVWIQLINQLERSKVILSGAR